MSVSCISEEVRLLEALKDSHASNLPVFSYLNLGNIEVLDVPVFLEDVETQKNQVGLHPKPRRFLSERPG